MILITGGAGYIGSHVNKFLYQRGFETVTFDNLTEGHRDFVKWGYFFHGDLSDRNQIRSCFQAYPIDAVMHFAGFASVGESITEPEKYYLNNVVTSLNLLSVMLEFKINKIIYSSSCSIYGNPRETPITEDHPQHPISPYGRSKFIVEQILKDYDFAYGLKHVNLRYFNAAGADPGGEIGERHNPEFSLIPLAIYAALGVTNDLKLYGIDYETNDGTCIRDYIHVVDLADAHLRALQFLEEIKSSQSINICNNRGYSVREVIDTVQSVTGVEFPITFAARRPGEPPQLVGSNCKAKELLDWYPQFGDIKVIIESAYNWHRKDIFERPANIPS